MNLFKKEKYLLMIHLFDVEGLIKESQLSDSITSIF